MIKSMTGFCRSEVIYKDIACSVEIRSVNHRFLDAKVHLPRQFQYFEETLKKQVKSSLNRGKVDIYLQFDEETEKDEKLSINAPFWENVKSTVKVLEEDLDRTIQVNLSDLLNMKGLLVYDREEKDTEVYEKLFAMAIERGIEDLTTMRKREGQLLHKELMRHVETLQRLIKEVPQFRETVVENHKQRLRKNLKTLGLKYEQDDPRIMQEIGIFLDRSDISEEVERFNTHLIQLRDLLENDGPAGRKLDFILQELNREANTLCSKANHTLITQTGVELKSEIEKIREQIQNIE